MRINFLAGFVCSALLLTGCQLLSPYKGPITPTPNQWKGNYSAPDAGKPTIPPDWKDDKPSELSPLILEDPYPESPSQEEKSEDRSATAPLSFDHVRRDLGNWWEIFQDPILNQLEEQALNSSYTLTAALERVIQARAQAAINYSPLLPGIAFSPSFSKSASLFQNPYTINPSSKSTNLPTSHSELVQLLKQAKKNAANGTSSPASLPADFRFIQSQYFFPLNINYEVDLWGQLHNAYYASVNSLQATHQDYLGVLLSLTADVAIAYFQVRGLDAQQQVIEENIRLRQRAVNLNQARYKAGLIVYLDVSKAIVELARAHADSDDIRRARGLQENQLAALIGVPPSVFTLKYDPVTVPPPEIPRGMPSELLCRRPDIAAAERNLASAYRRIGVAYGNFFPSFNLNTSIGFQTPFAPQLFSWRSRLWQVGWQFVQTVFDAGGNEANYEYFQSLYREAMAKYQETTLQAFKDVEDALVNLRGYLDQSQDLAIAVKYARLTLELAQARYDRGLTNYLDVVDAERQLLQTEQNAVIVLGSRYLSTIMLIRALGGGWGACETCQECENILEVQPFPFDNHPKML